MLPEKVKKQIEILIQNQDIGVVYSDIYEVSSKGCLASYPLQDEEKYSDMYNLNKIGSGNVLNNLLTEVFRMPTPSVMVRRVCFEKVGYYDESLGCEDPDMFLRLAKEYSYFYLPEALVIHRYHGKNSGRNSEIIVPFLYAMYEKYKEVSWLTEEQKKIICKTLRKGMPIDYFENVVTDKKLIIWGTGTSYSNNKTSIKNEVAFFIDSNPKMSGKVLDGRTVYPPEKLREINKEDYYLVIASSFRDEIKEEMNGFGFIENIDYQ